MIHSKGHIEEVSKSMATEYIKAVTLCINRLLADIPEDKRLFMDKGFRVDVDLNFLLISLNRLSRAVELYLKVSNNEHTKSHLRHELVIFFTKLDFLSELRNLGEHFDDYLLGEGRNKKVDTKGFQVQSFDFENGELECMGYKINYKEIHKIAYELYSQFLNEYKKNLKSEPPNRKQ